MQRVRNVCGNVEPLADGDRLLEVGLRLGVPALREIDMAHVVQRRGLVDGVPHLTLNLQRIFELCQRLVATTASSEEGAQIVEHISETLLVSDLAPEVERFPIVLECALGVARIVFHLSDRVQRVCHASRPAQSSLDGQGFLVVPERLLGLVEGRVCSTHRAENAGLRFVVPVLDPAVNALLRYSSASFALPLQLSTSPAPSNASMYLGVARQELREPFPRLVVRAAVLIQRRQRELHVLVRREDLVEAFVVFDGLLAIVQDTGVRSQDKGLLVRWQRVGAGDGHSREFLGVATRPSHA